MLCKKPRRENIILNLQMLKGIKFEILSGTFCLNTIAQKNMIQYIIKMNVGSTYPEQQNSKHYLKICINKFVIHFKKQNQNKMNFLQ